VALAQPRQVSALAAGADRAADQDVTRLELVAVAASLRWPHYKLAAGRPDQPPDAAPLAGLVPTAHAAH